MRYTLQLKNLIMFRAHGMHQPYRERAFEIFYSFLKRQALVKRFNHSLRTTRKGIVTFQRHFRSHRTAIQNRM